MTTPGTPLTNLTVIRKETGGEVGTKCSEDRRSTENVDLPLHDLNTLRFFYNVGLNYFRSFASVPPPPIQTPSAPPAELCQSPRSKQGQVPRRCHDPALNAVNMPKSSVANAYRDAVTAPPKIPVSVRKVNSTNVVELDKKCEVNGFGKTPRQSDSITLALTGKEPHDRLKVTELEVNSSKVWTSVRGSIKGDVRSKTDRDMNNSEVEETEAAQRKQNGGSPRSPDSGWNSESDASSEKSSVSIGGGSEIDSGRASLTNDEQNRHYDSAEDSEDRIVVAGVDLMSLIDRKLETTRSSACDKQSATEHNSDGIVTAKVTTDCDLREDRVGGGKNSTSSGSPAEQSANLGIDGNCEGNGEECLDGDVPSLLPDDSESEVDQNCQVQNSSELTETTADSTTSAAIRHTRSMKPIPARFRRLLEAEVQRVAAVRRRVEGTPLFACSAAPSMPAAPSSPFVVVCGEPSPMTSFPSAANVGEHCAGVGQQPPQLAVVSGNGFAFPPYFSNTTNPAVIHSDNNVMQPTMPFSSAAAAAISESNHLSAFTATSVQYQPMHYQLNNIEYHLPSNEGGSHDPSSGCSEWPSCATFPSAPQLYQSNLYYTGVPTAIQQQPLPAYVIRVDGGDSLPASVAMQTAINPIHNPCLQPDQVTC